MLKMYKPLSHPGLTPDTTYKSEKQDDWDCLTPPVNTSCLLLIPPWAEEFPKSKSELKNIPSASDPSSRILFCDGEK
jgi:hypothetical protein